jgi:chromosomal replication initiation ATPase DnaA
MEIYLIVIIIIAISLVAYKLLGKKNAPSRNTIFIVGEIGVGKTSLLYYVWEM